VTLATSQPGIIGYGHVGSQLGVLAEFLGMKVIWFDYQALMPIGNSTPMASMDELLRKADFVSIHVSEVQFLFFCLGGLPVFSVQQT